LAAKAGKPSATPADRADGLALHGEFAKMCLESRRDNREARDAGMGGQAAEPLCNSWTLHVMQGIRGIDRFFLMKPESFVAREVSSS
jgi:hypothetical protein